MHYLILDFDTDAHKKFIQVDTGKWQKWQRTPRGWHCYTNHIAPFEQICQMAADLGADPQWLKIGRERGYLFLADKNPIHLPWPVERMAIWWS